MSLTIGHAAVALAAADAEIPRAGTLEPSRYFRWKPVLGFILAAMLLVPAIPIILLTVLLVRLSSKGPGVFRQVRVGRHGKTFVMYKIRTMREDAEAATGPVWALQSDPRVTPVGRIVRKLHLDEFPQLWNVLRGEMSLIGPRPERPEFTQKLAQQVPGFLNRLAVRPGITGLSQINLPPDSDLDSVRRKLIVDLDYTKNASLWLDIRIFLCTFSRLVGIKGLFAARLLGIHRCPSLKAGNRPEPAASAPARQRRRRAKALARGRRRS